jgi:uncharacterized protein YciI
MVDAAVKAWCYLLRPTRAELLTDPTELEREIVGEHLAALGRLLRRGSLVLAGPSIAGADTFGIVVLEGKADEARRAMEEDPAVVRGVMTWPLRPFRIAFLRGRD